jgi:tRNA pseudouridine55 synthase
MTESAQGLLLLDKPFGVTSFDCVHLVRRRLKVKRVGHCGTLDPAARGLLMVLVGPATRMQDSFLGLEKEYWFTAEFGKKTSTADQEGEVIERKSFDHVTPESLEGALKTFEGEIQQLPPMYSALKYKGKHYYDYARQGIEIPRVPRPVVIHAISCVSVRMPFWEVRVVCSRGTYVRTLVEDIAERLGTVATLVELVRERVGPYRRAEALSWQELHVIADEDLVPLLRPVTPSPELTFA